MAGTYFDFSNTPITSDTTLKAKWCGCGGPTTPGYTPPTEDDYLVVTLKDGNKYVAKSAQVATGVLQTSPNSLVYLYPVNNDGSISTTTVPLFVRGVAKIEFGEKYLDIPSMNLQLVLELNKNETEIGILPNSTNTIGSGFFGQTVLNNGQAPDYGCVKFPGGVFSFPTEVQTVQLSLLFHNPMCLAKNGIIANIPTSRFVGIETYRHSAFSWDVEGNAQQHPVNVYGPYADEWLSFFPNEPRTYYRNLVKG